MSHMDFSSWPREQEASFVVYEQRNNESQRKAWTLSGIIAGIVLVAAIGISQGVEPDRTDFAKDMDMSNLTKKKSSSAPTPDQK